MRAVHVTWNTPSFKILRNCCHHTLCTRRGENGEKRNMQTTKQPKSMWSCKQIGLRGQIGRFERHRQHMWHKRNGYREIPVWPRKDGSQKRWVWRSLHIWRIATIKTIYPMIINCKDGAYDTNFWNFIVIVGPVNDAQQVGGPRILAFSQFP